MERRRDCMFNRCLRNDRFFSIVYRFSAGGFRRGKKAKIHRHNIWGQVMMKCQIGKILVSTYCLGTENTEIPAFRKSCRFSKASSISIKTYTYIEPWSGNAVNRNQQFINQGSQKIHSHHYAPVKMAISLFLIHRTNRTVTAIFDDRILNSRTIFPYMVEHVVIVRINIVCFQHV